MKDHGVFLRAALQVARRHAHLHIVMCGKGVERENPQLGPLAGPFPQAQLHMLGERDDVAALMSAMDVFCSSSRSEAFPNVLGEAMAASLPCVVTDVGDSAAIVADTGMVVPSGDADALARALEAMLNLTMAERAQLGSQARQRIEQTYSIASVSRTYEALYRSTAAGDG
jgi:glycosyltransferase involved in cell wall biosynthesis